MSDEISELKGQVKEVSAQIRDVHGKLTVMTDLMLALARVEERMAHVMEHNARQDTRADAQDIRITNLDGQMNGPNGLHARVARVVTYSSAAVLVGVFVINFYFSHLGK